MENIEKITLEACCTHYKIETTFIHQLDEYGLIALYKTGQSTFIEYDQLPNLEKYIRMHYDLEINLAGLEAIKHLIERIERLQNELNALKYNIS